LVLSPIFLKLFDVGITFLLLFLLSIIGNLFFLLINDLIKKDIFCLLYIRERLEKGKPVRKKKGFIFKILRLLAHKYSIEKFEKILLCSDSLYWTIYARPKEHNYKGISWKLIPKFILSNTIASILWTIFGLIIKLQIYLIGTIFL